jgi:hypothetical protein
LYCRPASSRGDSARPRIEGREDKGGKWGTVATTAPAPAAARPRHRAAAAAAAEGAQKIRAAPVRTRSSPLPEHLTEVGEGSQSGEVKRIGRIERVEGGRVEGREMGKWKMSC